MLDTIAQRNLPRGRYSFKDNVGVFLLGPIPCYVPDQVQTWRATNSKLDPPPRAPLQFADLLSRSERPKLCVSHRPAER